MFYTEIFLFSIFLFLFCTYLAFYAKKKYKISSEQFLAYLIASVVLGLFPLYILGLWDEHNLIEIFLLSVLGSLRSLSGEESVSDMQELLEDLPINPILLEIMPVYTEILYVLTAVLLLGFLLNLLQDFFPRLWYRFFAYGQLYIFTEISIQSVRLAEDIRQNRKNTKAVLVFLGSYSDKSINISLFESLKNIQARVLDIGIEELVLFNRFKKNNIHIFLMKRAEQENLRAMLKLVERYKEDNFRKDTYLNIYTFNKQKEAKAILDSLEKTNKIRLRLINETSALFYNLFNKMPLFLGEYNEKCVILVVGAGNSGSEAIKTALWCGQTATLNPEILVVDKDPLVQNRLESSCPGLLQNNLKEKSHIKFFTMDVQHTEFLDFLKEYREKDDKRIGYVISALGDDSLNIQASMKMRSVFEEVFLVKNGTFAPIINVKIRDSFLNSATEKLEYDAEEACNLSPFGSNREIYTWNTIVAPYFYSMGKMYNRFYALHYAKDLDKADKEYDTVEYARSSSIALALHTKYKLYSCLCELGDENSDMKDKYNWKEEIISDDIIEKLEEKLKGENSEDLIKSLAELEHKRWCFYTHSIGLKYADQKNISARFHSGLKDWDQIGNSQNVSIALCEELVKILKDAKKALQ